MRSVFKKLWTENVYNADATESVYIHRVDRELAGRELGGRSD